MGNFGESLGQGLHAEHRPVLLARTLPRADVALAEVRLDRPTHQRSDPLPPDESFVIAVQLRDFPVHEWWEDGRQAPLAALRAGQTTIYDLRRDPRFRINSPFHSIHVQLPLALLVAVAKDHVGGRIDGLDYSPGQPYDDAKLRRLTYALRPSFAEPESASRLFVDAITMAIASHTASTYGHAVPSRRRASGLAPWQRRRALALIDAHLDGDLRLADLAEACRLSVSHFTHAFRQSVGIAPHRWLLRRRVDKARALLTGSSLPLAEIALACGFAHQSHFTRVFTAIAGCSPGAWRRRHR